MKKTAPKYYATENGLILNYLFKRDNSFERLKDTTKLIDSIIYYDYQIEIIKKFHPDMKLIKYKRPDKNTIRLFAKKYNQINHSDIESVINHIKNN